MYDHLCLSRVNYLSREVDDKKRKKIRGYDAMYFSLTTATTYLCNGRTELSPIVPSHRCCKEEYISIASCVSVCVVLVEVSDVI